MRVQLFVCGFPLKMINSGNVWLCPVIHPLRVPFVMSLDESIAVYTVKNNNDKKEWCVTLNGNNLKSESLKGPLSQAPVDAASLGCWTCLFNHHLMWVSASKHLGRESCSFEMEVEYLIYAELGRGLVWDWTGAKLWSVEGALEAAQRDCPAGGWERDKSHLLSTQPVLRMALSALLGLTQLPSHSIWGILLLSHCVRAGLRPRGIVSK